MHNRCAQRFSAVAAYRGQQGDFVNQHPSPPVVITSARTSHSADIRRRQLRYLISMAIRTACFVLAFVTSGPLRWVFLAGSLLLPYVAVVIANTSTSREPEALAQYVADDAHALPGRAASDGGEVATRQPTS
jgi:hypothetical protein